MRDWQQIWYDEFTKRVGKKAVECNSDDYYRFYIRSFRKRKALRESCRNCIRILRYRARNKTTLSARK